LTITAQLADPAVLIFAQVLDLDWEGWRTEPRNRHGEWTRAPGGEAGFHGREATAGSGIQERVQAHIATLAGKVRPHELDNYSVGPYKREQLDPAYHYTPEQASAIRNYTDHSFELNQDQRGEPPASRQFDAGKLAGEADQISSAMHPLPDDLILLRELSGAHRMDGQKQGDVIADDGFASTTLTSGRTPRSCTSWPRKARRRYGPTRRPGPSPKTR
jgi:hypothetical protein